MDTLIFIAFCVFALLVGMRIKQRFSAKKETGGQERVNKNQRPKQTNAEEPPEIARRRKNRERRVRVFTIVQLVVLFGLMIFMMPALVTDILHPGHVDAMNMFLRCLIFIFTIYIFILGYIKVFRPKHKESSDK